jgi:hypothetical protein
VIFDFFVLLLFFNKERTDEEIAEELNITTTTTNFILATALLDSGTKIRMTFDTDESKTRQWLMASGATSWQRNSEYVSAGSSASTVEKRSTVIYLVLDCSRSLSTAEIGQIRTAAISFINNLYDQIK